MPHSYMVFKANLYNKHNIGMHHTEDYIWFRLCENACIYALGIKRVKNPQTDLRCSNDPNTEAAEPGGKCPPPPPLPP